MSRAGLPRCLGRIALWAGVLLAASGGRLNAATNALVDIRRDFHVRQWTTEHGLPDDRILSLFQTRDGYVWLGTRQGLLRFDGVKFTTFSRGNTPAVPENEIHGLAEDTEGTLWINGQATYLTTLHAGEFREVTTVEGKPVRGVLRGPSPRGGMWVSLEEGPHLTRWEHGTPHERWPLEVGINVAVTETADGALWVADPASFRRRVDGSWQDFEMPRPTNAITTTCLFAQAAPGTWFFLGAPPHPSRLYRLSADGPVLITDQLPPNDNRSRFLVAARDGSFWLPLVGSGLLNLRGTNQISYSLPWGRPEDHALCALEDREGNLWVGSEYSGLFRLRPKAVQMIGTGEGLPHENVRCVSADSAGQVWVGTDDGLAVLAAQEAAFVEPDAGHEQPVPHEPVHAPPADVTIHTPLMLPDVRRLPRPPLAEFSVRSLAVTGSGGAWVGTSRGLFRLGEGRYLPQSLPVLNHLLDQDGLASSKQRSVLLSGSGLLWSATPTVLSVLSGPDSSPRPVSVFKFVHGHNVLLEDRAGNMWVATDGAGVAVLPAAAIAEFLARPPRFSSTNLAFHDFSYHPTDFSIPGAVWFATTNGLPSNHAWELYEARDGAMWIATEGGVVRVPPDSALRPPHSAFAFTSAHGLPDHLVNSFVEDDHGHVWFGTDTGIFHIPHDDLLAVAEGRANHVHATTYGEADGLPSAETNGRISHPGVCKTPDGRLWFATTKGVAVFDPARLHAAEEVPPLAALEEVIADGERIFAHAWVGDDVRRLTSWQRMEDRGERIASNPRVQPAIHHRPSTIHTPPRLPPGRGRVLEFHFTGLNFAAPDQCRFQYRLDGYDDPGAWHDCDTRRLAYYTNLDPGDYRFEVLIRNHRNVLAKVPATFAFSVAPFLSQTWWFWTLVSLAGGGALAGLVAWRLRWQRQIGALEKQNALLQQRAGIARDLHDDLGPRLTQLALLTELAESRVQGLEDTAAARQQLAGIARDLSITLEGTLGALEPQADTLTSFADVLGDFAHEFLRPTGVVLHLERSAGIPPFPLARATKRQVFLIVKEALHNLVKHAAASRATLRLRAGERSFTVELADNGRGFDVPQLSTLNSQPPSTHSGLRNLCSRAEAIRASLEIESRSGQGTTVRLTVPLGGQAG